jgi:hypothetical protein
MPFKQSTAARKNIKNAATAARKKHHRVPSKILAHRARQKRAQAAKGMHSRC